MAMDSIHSMSQLRGTHGIGHVRMATESLVDVNHAHPFWAYPFTDVTVVHNGQLTNYHKLKRMYDDQGHRFQTGNDSELIAVYLADKLANGNTLDYALRSSLSDLDGTFTYLVSTKDGLGYAKDQWSAKPLVTMETDDIIARVGDAADPYERIVRVFKSANASYRSGRLYLALAAASDRPAIQQAVRRVSERRMAYLLDCYRALGLSEADARRWSTFAYATFMGNLQIRRDVPEAIPENQQFNDYLRLMIETLIPRVRREEQHPAAAEDRNDPPLQAVV